MELPAPASAVSGEFVAPRWLGNGHRMTLAASLWPRRFPMLPTAQVRLVEVTPDTRLRLDCHWQPTRTAHPTLLLVHGLEGSSESRYIRGTAEKAWKAGFNVVRLNVRNCGGTEHLTPTLYHSGLSEDLASVASHLVSTDGLRELHLAGFSMGGNQVLKLAAESGTQAPKELASVAAVSPALDLAQCAAALERPGNWFYQWYFTSCLKARLRRKAQLFPGLYQTDRLREVRTVRQFDDRFTAPAFGFRSAADYYARASALPLVARIAVPTFIVTAQDDPMVPIESFRHPALGQNPHVTLLVPRHGGHVGFISRRTKNEDRFWAENRILEFCHAHRRPERT